jgi:hypothetical protein
MKEYQISGILEQLFPELDPNWLTDGAAMMGWRSKEIVSAEWEEGAEKFVITFERNGFHQGFAVKLW